MLEIINLLLISWSIDPRPFLNTVSRARPSRKERGSGDTRIVKLCRNIRQLKWLKWLLTLFPLESLASETILNTLFACASLSPQLLPRRRVLLQEVFFLPFPLSIFKREERKGNRQRLLRQRWRRFAPQHVTLGKDIVDTAT